ncbi:MAG: 30S ribosome-binding factor RbfA [Planctomycetota bacterium]
MSHRRLQIESLLRKAIAQVLQRQLSDPRIQGMVSVTEVDVSPDLRNAIVRVSILPEKFEARTIQGLRDAAPYIHGKLKGLVSLRIVPHLDFRLDPTIKKESAVLDAINQAMERTGPDASELEDAPGVTDADDLPDDAGPVRDWAVETEIAEGPTSAEAPPARPARPARPGSEAD